MHKPLRNLIGTLLVFALVMVGSVSLLAQGAPEGRIAGVVHDPSGAVVAGASVTVINEGTNTQYTAKTSSEGSFVVPSIPAGSYTVKISAQGFANAVYSQVIVQPSKEYSLTATLKVGGGAETVEVTAGQELVNTTSSEVSKTIDINQVKDLPLNSRDVIDLIRTQPGVVYSGRTNTVINGGRTSWSQVTMDGINIQDLFIRTNALDYIPFRPSTEEVSEFTMQTGTQGVDAAMGASSVRMVTPSGTNAFHGSVSEYNYNSALAANTWFNNHSGTPRSFLNRNEFAAKVGGPIIKNKLFFWANYDGLRTRSSGSLNMVIPAHDDYLQGVYRYIGDDGAVHAVNVITGQGLTSTPATPLSIDSKIASAFIARTPKASNVNNFDIGDSSADEILNTAGYNRNQASNNDRNMWGFHIDYEMTPKHHFDFIWKKVHEITLRGDLDPINATPMVSNDSPSRLGTGSWRWTITPSLINNARIGGNKVVAPFLSTYKNTDGFLWNAAEGGSDITVSGINVAPTQVIFQTQGRSPVIMQYMDDATWVKGNHIISFGGQYQRQSIPTYNDRNVLPQIVTGFSPAAPADVQLTAAMFPGGIAPSDVVTANGVRAFLGGVISSMNQAFNVKNATSGYVPGQTTGRNLLLNDFTFYGQDKWRVMPNLTLTAGLKWEYISPYNETNGLMLGPSISSGKDAASVMLNPATMIDFQKKSWNKDFTNFGPSVGFAFDPFKDGKTSIRGGYTLTFVNDEIETVGQAGTGNAGLRSVVTMSGLYGRLASMPTIPTPTFKVPRTLQDQITSFGNSTTFWGINPDLTTPIVHSVSFGIEHEFKWDTALAVRYVGTMGRDLMRGIDLNQINAGSNQAYLADFNRARANYFNCGGKPAGTSTCGTPLTFFPTIVGAVNGITNSSTMRGYISTNEAAQLANYMIQNRTTYTNAPNVFLANPMAYTAYEVTNGAESGYHALQAEFNKRLAHGLQFQSNYTWSKLLSTTPVNQNNQSRLDAYLDNARPQLSKARADYDLRQSFKMNVMYDLPFGRGKMFGANAGKAFDFFLGGWQLSSIYSIQTGNPFSIYSGRGTFNRTATVTSSKMMPYSTLTQDQIKKYLGFRIGANGEPYFIDPKLMGANGRAVGPDNLANSPSSLFNQVFFNPVAGDVGNLGLLAFDGPGMYNLDFSVAKKFNVTERVNLQYRVDFFNLPNHTNFYLGDQNINSGTFGRIIYDNYSSAYANSTARNIQMSLRLNF